MMIRSHRYLCFFAHVLQASLVDIPITFVIYKRFIAEECTWTIASFHYICSYKNTFYFMLFFICSCGLRFLFFIFFCVSLLLLYIYLLFKYHNILYIFYCMSTYDDGIFFIIFSHMQHWVIHFDVQTYVYVNVLLYT